MWPFTKTEFFLSHNRPEFRRDSAMIMIMASFGVESLSANIPIEGAVQAALQKPESDPSLADWKT